MNQKQVDSLKGTLIVPVGLTIALVPFSFLIGWNLLTLVLFWFVLIPFLTIYLPSRISKTRNHLLESLAGLTIFYAIIVFMIYDHYKTDYFQLMMTSLVVNFIVVVIFSLKAGSRTQAQRQP